MIRNFLNQHLNEKFSESTFKWANSIMRNFLNSVGLPVLHPGPGLGKKSASRHQWDAIIAGHQWDALSGERPIALLAFGWLCVAFLSDLANIFTSHNVETIKSAQLYPACAGVFPWEATAAQRKEWLGRRCRRLHQVGILVLVLAAVNVSGS